MERAAARSQVGAGKDSHDPIELLDADGPSVCPGGPANGDVDRASAWKALLVGDDLDRAKEAVRALGSALIDPPPVRMGKSVLEGESALLARATLGDRAGLALFYAYLAESEDLPEAAERAMRLLEEASESAASAPGVRGLFGSAAGLLWVLSHLSGRLFDSSEESDELASALEAAQLAWLRSPQAAANYDLIGGLVGSGLVAAERFPHGRSGEVLERVLDLLEETSEITPPGISWFTPPEQLPDHQRETAPHGYWNLGLAHGVPGIVGLLGVAHRLGVHRQRCERLLEGAWEWLEAQEMPASHGCRFRAWIARDTENPPSGPRLAWCYNDLGASLVMTLAARAVGDLDRERHGIEIALQCSRLPDSDAHVLDTGLCHGAAGVAHLFHRLYRGTGRIEFAEAATRWYRRLVGMRARTGGLAGFKARITADGGEEVWVDDASLLSGAVGIGLALMAATSEVEPEWDRLLLASIPEPTSV